MYCQKVKNFMDTIQLKRTDERISVFINSEEKYQLESIADSIIAFREPVSKGMQKIVVLQRGLELKRRPKQFGFTHRTPLSTFSVVKTIRQT
jgi:hypothetical protein